MNQKKIKMVRLNLLQNMILMETRLTLGIYFGIGKGKNLNTVCIFIRKVELQD